MTQKVIKDGKQLAFPKLKLTFDLIFMLGILLLAAKLVVLALNKLAGLDIGLPGSPIVWNFVPLALMILGGIGSNELKDKFKDE